MLNTIFHRFQLLLMLLTSIFVRVHIYYFLIDNDALLMLCFIEVTIIDLCYYLFTAL